MISQFTTQFNTDWVIAGTGGMRDGTGNIAVGGISGTTTKSYLYWHGPTNKTDPTVNANVTVNGTSVIGTNIGFADDNNWGFSNSQAYRADMTGVINGNGTYNLSNFGDGPDVTTNGAATALFFDDGNTANNRDVVIFNGNDGNFASSFDSAGWDFTLSNINYTSGQASLILFVSDGQNFGSNDDGILRINGSPLVSGGIFRAIACQVA